MGSLVLVDSSVWIAEIRSKGVLEGHVSSEQIVTCAPVVQEVLHEAAQMYRLLRSKGFTIGSPNDCLIAACAIRNRVTLLHAGRDYDVIARVTMLQAVSLSG